MHGPEKDPEATADGTARVPGAPRSLPARLAPPGGSTSAAGGVPRRVAVPRAPGAPRGTTGVHPPHHP